MKISALHQLDFYKTGHINQYPDKTEFVYSNLTARSGRLSNVPNSKGVHFVGLQLLCKDFLIDNWNETFFNQPKDLVAEEYKNLISTAMNNDIDVSHIEKLHDLGYLPIKIKALPEGAFVPYGIPMMTIVNTIPEFYWLTNYLESVICCELWQMINSATTYKEYYRVFKQYADDTCETDEFVPFQAHDFSFRGMASKESGAKSAFACIAMGAKGTDTVPAIDIASKYYNATGFVAGSVNATEHSVMCAGGKESEKETFKRLLNDVYPTGILSVVSDTWDFWEVVTETLPRLKNAILKRDGKLVIRPDSGDPVDIICGTKKAGMIPMKPEEKGLIECLWDTFGGYVNSKNYKVLDSHIGAIYGDSITLDRQSEILKRLKAKGFASSNIVLGVGSYTYQYTTRDTHSLAFKATSVTIDGETQAIFKEPKTDNGVKKSAKGLLMVGRTGSNYWVKDECTEKEEKHGCLEVVFENGKLIKEVTLNDVIKESF